MRFLFLTFSRNQHKFKKTNIRLGTIFATNINVIGNSISGIFAIQQQRDLCKLNHVTLDENLHWLTIFLSKPVSLWLRRSKLIWQAASSYLHHLPHVPSSHPLDTSHAGLLAVPWILQACCHLMALSPLLIPPLGIFFLQIFPWLLLKVCARPAVRSSLILEATPSPIWTLLFLALLPVSHYDNIFLLLFFWF